MIGIRYKKIIKVSLVGAIAALALALVTTPLAGCSTKNASVTCDNNACTVTFARNATSEVSILGIKVKLVSVQNNQAVIQVGSERVTIPVGEKVTVLNGAFTVEVQQVTGDKVVVVVSRSGG